MKNLSALIFDMDGTLADTEETHRQAFNRAFSDFELGWDWTPSLYTQLLRISGGRERIAYYGADLAANFATQQAFLSYVAEIHTAKTSIYADMLTSGEVRLRPGVRRLIDAARNAGITLAIATSSAYSNVRTLLDTNLPSDWLSWFAAIESCDSVPDKKPSPAIYNAVLKKIAVHPARAIAIEDTQNGLRSAVAANISTIVTTHFFTRHHHFPQAILVLDSLGEVDQPFRVLAGQAHDHSLVDLALLEKLLMSADIDRQNELGWRKIHAANA